MTGTAEADPTTVPAESWKERAAYLAYASVERLAMTLPESVGRPVFDGAALAAFPLARKARSVVAENLGQVLGRPPRSPIVQAAVKEAFRSYARYWYETFHLRVMPDQEVLRRLTMVGREHIDAALERGRGAVMALPHLGNWDAAGHWMTLTGPRVSAVAEVLRPERLFRLFYDHRTALGMKVVPLYEDRKAAAELVELVAENYLIALVADRDLKGSGVEVEMFGRERRMPAGPALLALGTGSPLLPAACYDVEDGWVVQIGEPITIERTESMRDDVTTLTRRLAEHFERSIAASPTQWHMFQPAWETVDRPQHAPSAAASP